LTGRFWADEKTYCNQSLHAAPHLDETDMLLAVGWNPMMSHHTPRARRVLTKFGKDPDKLLVVVDPRNSEIAKIADIHLPIKPGTDALLYRTMISVILNEGAVSNTIPPPIPITIPHPFCRAGATPFGDHGMVDS
jgi:anaerobic selenocysteine-containing dehydrogenase